MRGCFSVTDLIFKTVSHLNYANASYDGFTQMINYRLYIEQGSLNSRPRASSAGESPSPVNLDTEALGGHEPLPACRLAGRRPAALLGEGMPGRGGHPVPGRGSGALATLCR